MKRRRIAILATNGFYCEMLAYGLVKAGHEVLYAVLSDNSEEPLETTLREIAKFAPEFALMFSSDLLDPSNERNAATEEFLKRLRIPVVCWLPDHPADAREKFVERLFVGPSLPSIRFLCHSENHIDYLRARNQTAAKIFFPVDEELQAFRATDEERAQFSFDFAFSGRHILDLRPHSKPVRSREEAGLRKTHIDICLADLRLKLAESDGTAIESIRPLIEEYFSPELVSLDDLRAAETKLFGGIAGSCNERTVNRLRNLFLLYIQNTYSFFKESAAVARLVKSKNLAVFGNRWHELFEVPIVRGFLNRRQYEAVCSSSKIVFSYTKHQLLDRSSERVLESLALGSFPLSNWTKEMDVLFAKDEVVAWKSLDEAEELFDFYIRNDSERRRIVERGRRKVLTQYTNVHWAKEMIRIAEMEWGF